MGKIYKVIANDGSRIAVVLDKVCTIARKPDGRMDIDLMDGKTVHIHGDTQQAYEAICSALEGKTHVRPQHTN